MAAWRILLIVSNVKANFSSWKEDHRMHQKLHKMEKKLIKNIWKSLLTIDFFVLIVRHNNAKIAKLHLIILEKLVNNIKSWNLKSKFIINLGNVDTVIKYCL